MKYIITEEQNLKMKVLRKSHLIDELIVRSMRLINKYYDICERGLDFFLKILLVDINEVIFNDFFNDVEDNSKEFNTITSTVENYVKSTHIDKITDFYKSKCSFETPPLN